MSINIGKVFQYIDTVGVDAVRKKLDSYDVNVLSPEDFFGKASSAVDSAKDCAMDFYSIPNGSKVTFNKPLPTFFGKIRVFVLGPIVVNSRRRLNHRNLVKTISAADWLAWEGQVIRLGPEKSKLASLREEFESLREENKILIKETVRLKEIILKSEVKGNTQQLH